jgi:hypothetical protein
MMMVMRIYFVRELFLLLKRWHIWAYLSILRELLFLGVSPSPAPFVYSPALNIEIGDRTYHTNTHLLSTKKGKRVWRRNVVLV